MRILVAPKECDRSEAAIFSGWVNAGVSVDMVFSAAKPQVETLKRGGIKIIDCDLHGRIDLKYIRLIRNLIRNGKYDIVYAPYNASLSNCLLANIGLGAKIVTYRGTTGHLHWYDIGSLMTYLNRGVTKIVCVSKAVENYLLSMGLPQSRLITIYKGHHVSWYSTPNPPSLSEFGIPGGSFIVGFTGNIRPVKGVDVLIDSFQYLKDKEKIHYLIIGEVRDGKVRRMLRSLPAGSNIHSIGYHKDASGIASVCDVFVMPSIDREGLPRAVVEAMAQGIPPIVSTAGGMPELVENGVSGITVPVKDPKALATAIDELYSDPAKRKEMGRKARERIINDFNVEKTIVEYLKLFRSLLLKMDET